MMLATLTVALAAGVAACQASSPIQTQALVELYTSQGCSSCPPADHWLSQLDPRASTGIVPLALHVGYWDYIGWKDPYARREFNARQEWLAQLNRNGTVYTPGVFLQAREMPRWSDPAAVEAALRSVRAKPARAKIDLAVQSAQAGAVRVSARAALTGDSSADARLFVALTESGFETKVKAGENRGATLHNDHVTRDWSGPLALGAQTVELAAPATATANTQRAIVAFVQDLSSGEVLQAMRMPLAACTP